MPVTQKRALTIHCRKSFNLYNLLLSLTKFQRTLLSSFVRIEKKLSAIGTDYGETEDRSITGSPSSRHLLSA